jgi:hypothetical protein
MIEYTCQIVIVFAPGKSIEYPAKFVAAAFKPYIQIIQQSQ